MDSEAHPLFTSLEYQRPDRCSGLMLYVGQGEDSLDPYRRGSSQRVLMSVSNCSFFLKIGSHVSQIYLKFVEDALELLVLLPPPPEC